ncbi:hypothetical protein Ae201684P_015869 [Aphanomyces euteiches]|nr:hypothetical protein Ae201684P_015869 [Aphanomyces euteiches]
MLWFAPILQFALSTMRILLFVAMVASVLGSSHPAVGRYSAQVRPLNRFLKGRFQKAGEHYGGKTGEIIGGGFGSALGTGMSAMLGTVTGGNIYTKAARNGSLWRIGRQVDKLTKSGRQAQAAAKTAKKERAEALKQPVLHTGGRHQKAKLSRTGSSPELLQRTGASPSGSKAPMNPGGSASTSGSHSPRNGGGASTSGTQLQLNLGLRKRKV